MHSAPVHGSVISGHGVASGRSADPRFPSGTITLQATIFRDRGVDIAALLGAEPYMGTINIDLSPAAPIVISPEIALLDVDWSLMTPNENFWLFRTKLHHLGKYYPALIYMPDPATKPEHFQPSCVLEVIAPYISMLQVGDCAELIANSDYIRFVMPNTQD